ncbi:MAG: sulfotransferase domain-containing protein [Bdellovibrionota bacterium]|nr:sulfotransferase domain-containing protein [Bdellovibrionota bacterium]
MQIRNFCIITMGRTGSSWVCDLLNSHDQIECFYERLKDHSHLGDEEKYNYFIDCFKGTDKINLAKILFYQLPEKQLERLFKEDLQFIIIRRNPLDRFISLKLAEATGLWHLDNLITEEALTIGIADILRGKYSLSQISNRIIEAGKSYYDKWTYKPVQIELNQNELIESIEYENKMVKWLEDHCTEKCKTLHVFNYDELFLMEPPKRDELLLQTLGLPYKELFSSREKIDYHTQSERVSNYLDLKKALESGPYHQFFKV